MFGAGATGPRNYHREGAVISTNLFNSSTDGNPVAYPLLRLRHSPGCGMPHAAVTVLWRPGSYLTLGRCDPFDTSQSIPLRQIALIADSKQSKNQHNVQRDLDVAFGNCL
jgi:hypothetical protein